VGGIAAAPDGTIYAADTRANRLLGFSPDGRVSIVAGDADGQPGFFGDNVLATGSRLDAPAALHLERDTGVILVVDAGNGRIRHFTPGGRMYTLAGGGSNTDDDVPAAFARLDRPSGIAEDGMHNLFVTERGPGKLRRIDATGNLKTVATFGPGTIGPVAASARDDRLWVAEGGKVLLFRTSRALPWPAPRVVFEAPASEVTGLAFDEVGALYVAHASSDAGLTVAGRVSRVHVAADGSALARAPELVAGREDAGGTEADYLAPNVPLADGRQQHLAMATPHGLAIDLRALEQPGVLSGALVLGNSYDDRAGTAWGQMLRLEPLP
jgi:hypothetical protein